MSNKNTADTVADYYNRFTDLYLETTGDFIQAFRPQDTNALMQYITASANIQDAEYWLDAGCGVGAASIWLAKSLPKLRLSGVTISSRQQQIATQKIANEHLGSQVEVRTGDYHLLAEQYVSSSFDGVFFLESLGHSHDVAAVMKGVAKVLKRGGKLYIKDFFVREAIDETDAIRTASVIELINEQYAYNTLSLPPVLEAMKAAGFMVEFARTPAIESDIQVTIAFEEKSGRKTYPSFMQHPAAEWFEIKATL